MKTVFEQRSRMPAPAQEVFEWHLRPGAFERLLPPGDDTRVVERTGRIEDDTMRIALRVPVLGPVRQTWHIRHEGFDPGRSFRDVLDRGPFRSWVHEHRVERDTTAPDACSWLVDHVEYELPLGALGRLGGGRLVRARLERTFRHRHDVMVGDLSAHAQAALRPGCMVAVHGAGQPLGRHLLAYLSTGGTSTRADVDVPGLDVPVEDARATPADAVVVLVDDRALVRLGAQVAEGDSRQRTVELSGSPVEDPRHIERELAHLLT